MRAPLLALLAPVAVTVLAGCPDDPDPVTNPPRLWLALLGSETMVQLQPVEPRPY